MAFIEKSKTNEGTAFLLECVANEVIDMQDLINLNCIRLSIVDGHLQNPYIKSKKIVNAGISIGSFGSDIGRYVPVGINAAIINKTIRKALLAGQCEIDQVGSSPYHMAYNIAEPEFKMDMPITKQYTQDKNTIFDPIIELNPSFTREKCKKVINAIIFGSNAMRNEITNKPTIFIQWLLEIDDFTQRFYNKYQESIDAYQIKLNSAYDKQIEQWNKNDKTGDKPIHKNALKSV
eukprot:382612_1